ncbi:ankyrin [Hypoxylon sp. EC38]|nr:ankyrin [Hypoxylon sp. EC38]
MEAIGAGANVLAFVLLTLKSAKTAYETLSAIKDGPQIVKQVAGNINQLCWILENLKASRAAAEDISLVSHLKVCHEELRVAASWIEKLQISPTERQSGRLWRRLKSFFSEKDLERFNIQLIGHVTTLNLRLQGISSNVVCEIRDDQVQFERTMSVLNQTVQTQARMQETNFSSLKQNMSDTINTQSETIRTGLDTLNGNIAALTSVSQPQGQSMLDLLQEIKGLLITSTQQDQVIAAESRSEESISSPASPSQSCSQGTPSDDTELINSIDRLCDLIHDKGRTIDTYSDDNEESQNIIQNLQTILRSASEQGQVVDWNPTHSKPGETSEEEFKRISRRFERAFDQYRIAINQGATIRKCSSDRIIKRTRGYQKVRMKIGTLALMFDHRKWSPRADDSSHDATDETYSDYTITSTFFPDDPRRFHMLVASTFQHEIRRGAVSSISRLAVNRVLPIDSRVFEVVKDGDLHELQRMLQNGEASLRDHDEHGASLLLYSTFQPAVCKFLIENGLDVDHVGGFTNAYGDFDTFCALQVFDLHFLPRHAQDFTKSQRCLRMLLEAGADPTLTASETRSFLGHVSSSGIPVLKRLAWDPELTGYIAPIKTFTEEGLSPLLILCELEEKYIEDYSMLLDLGADIHARDPDRRTCLHILLQGLNIPPVHRYRETDILDNFEVLQFLVEMGADVRATDRHGTSVSDCAYGEKGTEDLGSYAGDLWDSVLHSCGYEITDFRTLKYPRKAKYNSRYGRDDFEVLWRGREHLCPYWDDRRWLPQRKYATDPYDTDINTDSEESLDWDSESDSEGGGAPIE